jgi:hypothetical protein
MLEVARRADMRKPAVIGFMVDIAMMNGSGGI